MTKDIADSVVLLTGAAGSIGSAVAKEFARRGARLVLSDRDSNGLERLVDELSDTEVRMVVGDVADESHHLELLAVAESLGGADISILNAGIYLPGLVWEQSVDQWRLQIEVNFWGVVHGIRHAVPAMIERGSGHIVAVASGAGLLTTPALAPYVASKHAVVGLMETLRHELNRVAPNVGASVVCPGNVRSDMAGNSLAAAGIVEENLAGVAESVAVQVRAGVDAGMGPEVVALAILEAIESNRFWVLSHPEVGPVAVDRMERARDGREPVDFFS